MGIYMSILYYRQLQIHGYIPVYTLLQTVSLYFTTDSYNVY